MDNSYLEVYASHRVVKGSAGQFPQVRAPIGERLEWVKSVECLDVLERRPGSRGDVGGVHAELLEALGKEFP